MISALQRHTSLLPRSIEALGTALPRSLPPSAPTRALSTLTMSSRPRGHRPHRGGKKAVEQRSLPPHLASRPFATSSAASLADTSTVASEDRQRFRDFTGLHPDFLETLPFEFCTEVQAATLPTILESHDVLAQAKTGTGKTLAFLIPAIQHLIQGPLPGREHTSILVLSPTRELAQQIGLAAEALLKGVGKGKYAVRCVVGGTNVNSDVRALKEQRADILVATPGRLLDLLDNYGTAPRLAKLRTLVLDEADRLLDQGFRRELQKILETLPNRQQVPRQTLLFSATVSKEVRSIASLALRPDHKFITTLTEEDVNTHEHVIQESLIVSPEDIIAATWMILERERAKSESRGGFKVMVFLPTARAAALYHDIFAASPASYPVWEIHSRMSQSKRTHSTDEFKAAQSGVLFSSDVTARGIDVKGVTAVVQVGLPMNAEQYIHRLGRTARAGAEGHGILILGDFEAHFLADRTISSLSLQSSQPPTSEELSSSRLTVNQALATVPDEAKGQAYQAWLGYYNSCMKVMRWSQPELVRNANAFAKDAMKFGDSPQGGWKPPPLLARTVGKMGLRGVQGLNIVQELPGGGGGQGGRGGHGQAQGTSHGTGNGGGPRQGQGQGHVAGQIPGQGQGQAQNHRANGIKRSRIDDAAPSDGMSLGFGGRGGAGGSRGGGGGGGFGSGQGGRGGGGGRGGRGGGGAGFGP